MRIGIDIRSLIFTQAGISTYIHNLIKALGEIDKRNKYILFCHAKSQYNWAKYGNISEKVLRLPHIKSLTGRIWEAILVPRAIASMKIDIFHGPSFTLPSKKPCKFIVTIHDLTFKRFPELVTKRAVSYYNAHIQSAIKKADRIIADSYNTKEDLMILYGVGSDRVEVIYMGIDKDFRVIEDKKKLKEVKDKYGLPKKFILSVGTIEPRKNLRRLIEAYYQLREKGLIEHSLVIAGQKGWLYENVFEAVKRLKLEQEVIFTGYITRDDLPMIYNSADLFIFPSIYEGFGLPALEAMACGIPVITSNISSLPEITGDAALLINPYDVEAIAKAMERVLGDDGLRKELVKKGLKHARRFSWQDSAKKTLMAYREVSGT